MSGMGTSSVFEEEMVYRMGKDRVRSSMSMSVVVKSGGSLPPARIPDGRATAPGIEPLHLHPEHFSSFR